MNVVLAFTWNSGTSRSVVPQGEGTGVRQAKSEDESTGCGALGRIRV